MCKLSLPLNATLTGTFSKNLATFSYSYEVISKCPKVIMRNVTHSSFCFLFMVGSLQSSLSGA